MPFEQKYDAATREAATARVLQRRATNPGDRSVLRVVSDEFNVGQQSLRAWVAAAEAEAGVSAPAPKKRRPRFSKVVTSTIAPVPEAVVETPRAPREEADSEPQDPAHPAAPSRPAAPQPRPTSDDVSALEIELAGLRRGNEALKGAMRVLLAD